MAKSSKADLKSVIAAIEKIHGSGSAFQMGNRKLKPIPFIPSGSLNLDLMSGIGGFPRGRIIELFGVESGGKTTLALQAVGNAQREGGLAGFVDAEHALNQAYARNLGADIETMVVSQPDYGEQGLDIAHQMVISGLFSIVVVDSVAALVPKAELEGEFGDSHMGLQARMMGQAMRKLAGVVRKSSTALIFINQLRDKIGVIYGSPKTTPGGRALKFWASLRVEVSKGATLKDGDRSVGARTRINIVKSKVGLPFQEGEVDMIFGRGFSREGEILDIGAAESILEKSGSWYNFKGERLGQGREGAREFLIMNPSIAQEIEVQIRTKFKESGRLA